MGLLYHHYEKTAIYRPNVVIVPYRPLPIPPAPIPLPPKPDNKGIDFISVSEYRSRVENSVYSDVLSHSRQKPHGNQDGRYTNVHETAHGIHNELRNEYSLLLKTKINGFYCLDGKAVIVKEPPMEMRHCIPYIPQTLRSSRYKLYFTQQIQHWNNTPTYILDEWNCYLLGAECAIDDFRQKKPLETTNAVSGCFEFAIYSVAMCMAIKDINPEYWKTHYEFKEFIRYCLIRTERAFGSGLSVVEFYNTEQNRLYEAFLRDPSAGSMREFLKTEFAGVLVVPEKNLETEKKSRSCIDKDDITK
jgi:hypothetical protein